MRVARRHGDGRSPLAQVDGGEPVTHEGHALSVLLIVGDGMALD